MESLDEIGVKYAYNFGVGKQYTGGDKTSLGNNFTKDYELLFEHKRNDKLNLLELGIFYGKSLAMWSDYFPKSMIYGIDLKLDLFSNHKKDLVKLGAFKNDNIQVLEQDLTDEDFKKNIDKLPNFDIIIDDALHRPETQYNNFLVLFPRLNKGGIYVIEDIISPVSFFEYFKDILACVAHASSVKNTKTYGMAIKISSFTIKSNLVIITK
jgi:predicted O-methyltransferase YrrM